MQEKGSIDRTINQLLLSVIIIIIVISYTLGPKAPKTFLSIENGQIFFSPNTWQMMVFLNPLDALIPKIPFSFFSEFWVRVTSGARGSVSLGFGGPVH